LWEEKQKKKIHSVGYKVKQEDIIQDEVVTRVPIIAVENDGPVEKTRLEGMLEQDNNTLKEELDPIVPRPTDTAPIAMGLASILQPSSSLKKVDTRSRHAISTQSRRKREKLELARKADKNNMSSALPLSPLVVSSASSTLPQSSFGWQPPVLARNPLDGQGVKNIFTGTPFSIPAVTATQLETLSVAAFAPVHGVTPEAEVTVESALVDEHSDMDSEYDPITLEVSSDALISFPIMALVAVQEPQFEDDASYGYASGYEYLLTRDLEDEMQSSSEENDIFDSDVASNGTRTTSPTVSCASDNGFAFDESAEDYILETYSLSPRFTGLGENDEDVVFDTLDSTVNAPLIQEKAEYVSHGTQTALPGYVSQDTQTALPHVSRDTQFSWADHVLESSTSHDATAAIVDSVPQDGISILENIVDVSSDATELGDPAYIANVSSDDLFVEDLGKKALQLKLSFEALEHSKEWADFLVAVNALPEHPCWEVEQKEQQIAPIGQAVKVQDVGVQHLRFSDITMGSTEPTSAQDGVESSRSTEEDKLGFSPIPTIVIKPPSAQDSTRSKTSTKDMPATFSLAKKPHHGLSLSRNTYRSFRSPRLGRRTPTLQPPDPTTVNMGTNEYDEPAPFEMSER
jgi:hypothetical protein